MNSLAVRTVAPKTASQARAASAVVEPALTQWSFGLALSSLLIAGCFSLLLVIGRLPIFSAWVTDPLFFRRCLVLHVDLALVVWFFSFAAGLYSLLPGNRSSNLQFRAGLFVATAGCAAMILGTMIPGTAPVLANYVPVIDNALYVGGVALFFGGLLLAFVSDRLFIRASVGELSEDVAIAIKAVAVAFVLAVTTFFIAVGATPRELEGRAYYELVFWGGGHVLQVANVAAMLGCWLYLLGRVLGRSVLTARAARISFGLLLAPHFVAPLLTVNGTVGPLYRQGFTRLMQFGIAPVVLALLWICGREILRARKAGVISTNTLKTPSFIGFAGSAALTITGFAVGSTIRSSNTVIPAHYHASIGAVTVAFMAITYELLPKLGLTFDGNRLARLVPWQLPLFGFGQVIFAVGFGLGGFAGLSRKTYGAEQHIRTVGEFIGLGIMGIGGLIAVAGGLLFLLLMTSAVAARFGFHFRKPQRFAFARIHP